MSDRLPAKLTIDQITALCQYGLGDQAKLASWQEIGGGTLNEIYLVELVENTRVVLRVGLPFDYRRLLG